MCKCKNCCFGALTILLIFGAVMFFAYKVLIETYPSSRSCISTEQVSIQENFSQNSDACNKNTNTADHVFKKDKTKNIDFYPILCITFFISLAAVLIFLIWILSKDDSDIKYSKLEMLEKIKENHSCCLKCSRFETYKKIKENCHKCCNKSENETTKSRTCAGKDLLKQYMTCIAEV